MKHLILFGIFVALMGCESPSDRYYVKCKNGYEGKARYAVVTKHGTEIMFSDGHYIEYSPAVECEVRK